MNTITRSEFRKNSLKSILSIQVLLLLLSLPFSGRLIGQTYNVTFSVDMNNVASSFTTPQVNGTFNSWCCTDLSDANSDGIWEATLALSPGTYEFKFAADFWNIQENLTPGTAGTITSGGFTNRVVTVVNADITMPTVCWGFGVPCAAAPIPQNVTFRVDMNNVPAGFGAPSVNGTFNGWCGNCNLLSDANSDGIWETTIALLPGDYQYKFAYDNWAGQETLIPGASCTFTDGPYTNRIINVANSAQTLPVVCWGSCASCAAPDYNVTFKVDMANVSGFTTPYLNGSFNGWCGTCTPMTQVGTTSVWQTTVPLQAGTYEYKFTYEGWTGQENLTPGSSCTVTSGPYTNRVITVAANQTLPVVCWEACGSCVAPVADVTFKVDMTNETGFSQVYVSGTFNGWCGDCNALSDADANGIWEGTFPIPAGTIEFKYTLDNWAGNEALASGSSCTQTTGAFTNRILNVGTTDITMPVTCYGSCSSCATPSGPYNVTFKVDMTGVSGFTTPYVNGTFNNWCGSCAPMVNTSGNIWELTISVPAGPQEYKFTYEGWTGQENLIPGSTCTVTNFGYTNRSLNVASNTVLPVVCWESCTSCSAPTPLVTFRVDMNNVSDPFTTPEVNGTFNNWCGGCAPMSDDNGDNVWEITIPLAPGTYEYKFANDSWSGQEFLTPGSSCTVTNGGFTNRNLVVTNSVVLPVVCWATCSTCSTATWTSVQSGNWGAISTWNQGTLPPTGAEVVVASGTNVTINSNTTITALTVESGASLTINADLKINNGGVLYGQTTVNSDKDLLIAGGTLTSYNTLLLKSGSNLLHGVGTPGGGGSVVGNIRYEQIGNSSYNYNFWSSPVSGANSILLGQQRYYYDPAIGTASTADDANEPGWVPANGIMNVGQGYASVYGGTVTFAGTANNGNINVNVLSPGGAASNFNLVGNPYPSALNANSFLALNGPSGSNRISGALYFWDDDNAFGEAYTPSDYAVWNGAGSIGGAGNAPNGFIAPAQGFLVAANSSGALQFNNALRSNQTSIFFEESEIKRFKLAIRTQEGDYNETLIAFTSDATNAIDGNYDAVKLKGNANLALFSKSGEHELAIQGLPFISDEQIVPLGIYATSNQTMTIELRLLENFEEGAMVYLIDQETGTIVNLRAQNTYQFIPGTMSLIDRFYVRFVAPITVSALATQCGLQNGEITIENPSSSSFTYSISTESGAIVSAGNSSEASLSFNALVAGNYQVQIGFTGDYSVNFPAAVSATEAVNLSVEESLQVSSNEAVSLNCISNGTNIIWTLENGQVIGSGASINYVFDTPGVYMVSVTATLGGCEIQRHVSISVSSSLGIQSNDNNSVDLYPNPASEVVSLTLPASLAGNNVVVTLFDLSGKVVFRKESVANSSSLILPVAALERGVYMVNIASGNVQVNSKLMLK